MNFGAIPTVQALQARMQYSNARMQQIAQNIANVDTPEYKAKDLAPVDFRNVMAGAGGKMTLTNPMHMENKRGGGGNYTTVQRRDPYEVNPNGNTVSLDEELQNMALTQGDYGRAIATYRKMYDMFRLAAGRGGGA